MSEPEKKPVSETVARETEVLKFWEKESIFQKSIDKEPTKGDFVFYDGPPFATGTPHYGHLLQSAIKDAIPRYKTMQGYRVRRQWGWDCHGLPIENIVEKELGTKSKKDILDMGVKKFNDLCRERIFTFIGEWERIIPRFGRWADMAHPYRTMDFEYMQSEWWAFKSLHEDGLVYEDYRSMHVCTRCETTLSQGEVAEGYKDVKDIAVTVKFELVDEPGTYMLAWTTTPWTLPGNVAIAVGKDIGYVKVPNRSVMGEMKNSYQESIGSGGTHSRVSAGSFIMSKDILWNNLKSNAGHMEVRDLFPDRDQLNKDVLTYINDFEGFAKKHQLEIIKGSDLVGKSYKPLFDYYSKDTNLKNRENGWKVYAADFVTADSGTGIAHEAPAFGADDWELLKKENLPFVQHVNYDGTMKPEVTDFAGMEVKPRSDDDKVRLGTDIAMLKYLQEHGLFFSKENIVHSYPHCWRCDTPLLNYATSSWFVSVTKIKDRLLETAKDINWSPEHIKEGRWGQWLQGARDWSISRQRFWANTIPVWRCDKCRKDVVFGSAQELKEASGKSVTDLHKDVVDEVTFACSAGHGGCGGTMRRVPDVLDTWFDSGSAPFATRGFSDAEASRGGSIVQADFIAEAQDQTRAWFYYMHVLGVALFDTNAFKNCITTGIVLAEDGKKMSKKLKNYPDPVEMIEKYGADAMRFYMLSSPVVRAEPLSFSEKGVDEVLKKNIGRLNNVLAFYKLYADPATSLEAGETLRDWKSENLLDRWILIRLDQLLKESTAGFERYQLDSATRPLPAFIDDLSVWYLRRSRDRFREDSPDKRDALATLRYVLHRLALLMAPVMPFYAEYLFQAVREGEDEESVHLASWPEPTATANFFARLIGKDTSHAELLRAMDTARGMVTLALEAREKAGVKIRQPLGLLSIPSDAAITEEFFPILMDELNVKRIEKRGVEIFLDTVITDDLRKEGLVREARRALQGARKTANMKPADLAKKAVLSVSVGDKEALIQNIEELKQLARVAELEIQMKPELRAGEVSATIE